MRRGAPPGSRAEGHAKVHAIGRDFLILGRAASSRGCLPFARARVKERAKGCALSDLLVCISLVSRWYILIVDDRQERWGQLFGQSITKHAHQ